MRLFIALELPDSFVEEAAGVARTLSHHLNGRFMKRSTYHLTLAFIGELNPSDVSAAVSALDAACAGFGPIAFGSDGLGKFGRPHDATLWMGITAGPDLARLAARVREELASHGVPFDAKPFKPHLTLARRVRISKGALPALAFPGPATARRATLFKSTLTREGAVYKALHTVELLTGNGDDDAEAGANGAEGGTSYAGC